MNKLYKLLFLISLLLFGCKYQNIEEQKITQSIDNFKMNILSSKGKKIFTINSPYSIYDKESNVIRLDKTTIHSFNENEVEYIINSDKSKFSNNNKLLELNGNVIVSSLIQKDDKLNSNNFTWNIKNSDYLLTGNVKFENNLIKLSSNKAILKKDSNIIEFFNPVKYIIKNSDNKDSYEINSENAYYNIDTKSVSFSSFEKRVRSKIFF